MPNEKASAGKRLVCCESFKRKWRACIADTKDTNHKIKSQRQTPSKLQTSVLQKNATENETANNIRKHLEQIQTRNIYNERRGGPHAELPQ